MNFSLRKNVAYVAMASLSVVTAGLLLASAGVANAQTAPANAPGSNGGAWHGRGGSGGGMMGHGIFGTVTAINGTTLTITSKIGPNGTTETTYTVNGGSATVTKNGASSTFSNIAVGDTIIAQGTVSGTTVTATAIRDGAIPGGPGMMGGRAPGVFGTVASVNGDTLTVTSKMGPNGATATTYTVLATNATVTKNDATSTISAIAVGDNVAVVGMVSGTTITATSIRDGVPQGNPGGPRQPVQPVIQGNGEPVIGGAITAINGTSLTVTNKSNVTYTVDVSSATVVKGNATSSLANVSVGDNVVIQGTVNGTSVTASSVIDQGAVPTNSSSTSAQGHGGGFMGGIFNAIGGFFSHLFGF